MDIDRTAVTAWWIFAAGDGPAIRIDGALVERTTGWLDLGAFLFRAARWRAVAPSGTLVGYAQTRIGAVALLDRTLPIDLPIAALDLQRGASATLELVERSGLIGVTVRAGFVCLTCGTVHMEVASAAQCAQRGWPAELAVGDICTTLLGEPLCHALAVLAIEDSGNVHRGAYEVLWANGIKRELGGPASQTLEQRDGVRTPKPVAWETSALADALRERGITPSYWSPVVAVQGGGEAGTDGASG